MVCWYGVGGRGQVHIGMVYSGWYACTGGAAGWRGLAWVQGAAAFRCISAYPTSSCTCHVGVHLGMRYLDADPCAMRV